MKPKYQDDPKEMRMIFGWCHLCLCKVCEGENFIYDNVGIAHLDCVEKQKAGAPDNQPEETKP